MTDYLACAKRATDYLTSCDLPADDFACVYKQPMLWMLQGRYAEAHGILCMIKHRFMTPEGDFETAPGKKSAKEIFGLFPTYLNGWVCTAAQRLGRFEISYPAYARINQMKSEFDYGIFGAAHLGMCHLYMGNLSRAVQAGNGICKIVEANRENKERFYLRTDEQGNLLRKFPAEMAGLYVIERTAPDQLYFFIGYPMAFLTALHRASSDPRYLEAAEEIVAFAASCTGTLRHSYLSHKVAWGAARVARATGSETAATLAREIADYLISIQNSDGSWLSPSEPLDHYDQTAEIALWLTEIHSSLRHAEAAAS